MPLLDGRRLLVTGVLTDRSIAFAVAAGAQREGAEVVLTGFGRSLRLTERIAQRLPRPADVLELDVDDVGQLAALESINRYLARDLGARGIRANLVSAGPLRTMAANAIPGFDDLAGAWERQAPLAWDTSDAEAVAEACLWLLSERSRGVTGEIVHVDGGYHAMGAPLNGSAPDRP